MTPNQKPKNNQAANLSSPPAGERTKVRGRTSTTNKTKAQARRLRKQPTPSESKLWKLLRDRRLVDFKFRRQYSCGSYILDFYCAKAKLAIELDGGGHGLPRQRSKDEQRDQFLASREIKVLRFWNHKLHDEMESVLFEIWYALMKRTGRTDELANYKTKPSPSSGLRPPSPMRERNGNGARRR